MVMHGQKTTLNISLETMALHVQSVGQGLTQKLLVGDLPFMSYRKSLGENMTAIETIMKAGAHAVKLEGAEGNLSLVEHTVQSGVPVMGHLGLTPQSVYALGGFKVQGREKAAQEKIFSDAIALEQAGCFSLVLECVPTDLAQKISEKLQIPVIGIGAGPHVDGQILVLHDLLGLTLGFKPSFLRHYLEGADLVARALAQYHNDVVEKTFPAAKESYS
jgi:3-methyl-2-oxobutanoate hydroxymethyltransferase